MNNNKLSPGNKGNLRLYMNKVYLAQTLQLFDVNVAINEGIFGTICDCTQNKKLQQPTENENERISRVLTGTLGGKTTFGNNNRAVRITYLGGWEGQPGGAPRPLRNKF
jgi:hypothetical protein